MPKVRYPLNSEQVSGSVGNTVYFRLPAGNVCRRRVKGAAPTSSKQLGVQHSVDGVVDSWQSLSDEQRAAWSDYAAAHPLPNRFGHYRPLTGYHMFMKSNLPLNTALSEGNIAPWPRLFPAAVNLVDLQVVDGAGLLVLVTTYDGSTPNGYIDFWLSCPGGPGRHWQLDSAQRFAVYPWLTDYYGIELTEAGTYAGFLRILDLESTLPGPWTRFEFTMNPA